MLSLANQIRFTFGRRCNKHTGEHRIWCFHFVYTKVSEVYAHVFVMLVWLLIFKTCETMEINFEKLSTFGWFRLWRHFDHTHLCGL